MGQKRIAGSERVRMNLKYTKGSRSARLVRGREGMRQTNLKFVLSEGEVRVYTEMQMGN
jgi:hypothetical protein